VNSRVAALSTPYPFTVSRAARIVAAALPLLAAHAAFAQAAAGQQAQEVVVTAARVEQTLPDTLPSTTVITRADIDASPALDLPDLMRTFTSFNVAQTGPLGSQTSVFVRGANSNQVLGADRRRPADARRFRLRTVGTGAAGPDRPRRGGARQTCRACTARRRLAAVVQIFTRHGAGTSVAFGGGSRGTLLASASTGQRFGDAATPLDISASISGAHTDGFSARDARIDPSVNPDRDASTQSGETFSIGKTWAPGQRTSLTALHSDSDVAYDGYNGPAATDKLKSHIDNLSLQSRHALTSAIGLDLHAGEDVIHYDDATAYTARGTARTRLLGIGADWTIVEGQNVQVGYENDTEAYGDSNTAKTTRRTNSIRAGWLGSFGPALEIQANIRHDDASDYGTANTGLLSLGWRLSPEWKLVAQGSTAFLRPELLGHHVREGPADRGAFARPRARRALAAPRLAGSRHAVSRSASTT